MSDQELYIACKIGHRKAQKLFYDRFAAQMLAVCLRYVHQPADAEDVFIEGIFKAMTRLDSFRDEGSLEGWVRRIMVNECLMFIRRQKHFQFADDASLEFLVDSEPDIGSEMAARELLKLVDLLPLGCKTVFNLYALEGMKHQEIADLLGISVNTTKTQLMKARLKLQDLVRTKLGVDATKI